MSPPRPQAVTIDGPAGSLKLVVEDPGAHEQPAAFMVVCHPHPLHGGTMDNKVVTTLARCAHELQCAQHPLQFSRRRRAAPAVFDEGAAKPMMRWP